MHNNFHPSDQKVTGMEIPRVIPIAAYQEESAGKGQQHKIEHEKIEDRQKKICQKGGKENISGKQHKC